MRPSVSEMTGPPVVCCAGPAGSGKSSVGAALATRLGWAVVDQDSATNPLMEQVAAAAGVPFDLDAPRLRGPVRDARYACVTAVARDNARLGVSTILVAPFTAELNDRAAFDRLREAVEPGRAHLVLVDTPESVRRARSALRATARDRTPKPPARAQDGPTGHGSTRPTDIVVVSGLETPEATASRIIETLRLGGLPARSSAREPKE